MSTERAMIMDRMTKEQARTTIRLVWDRAAAINISELKDRWQVVLGLELRKNLRELVRLRMKRNRPIGNEVNWTRASAYVSVLIDDAISARLVRRHCRWIGVPVIDPILAPIVKELAAAHQAGAIEVSPAIMGDLINLSAEEREALGIRRIDAWDEPADERERRLSRERQARRREQRGAKPRSRSIEAEKPWRKLGISRATFFRRVRLKRHAEYISFIRNIGERDETVSNASERDEIVSPVIGHD